MTRDDAAALAQRLLEAWNARDLDAFMALLADDVEWYDPAMHAPPARGRAAVRAFADAVIEAFPDFTYEIQPPICTAPDGSRCAIMWRITATHRHPLRPLSFAPTGRRASFTGVDVIDVRGGRVTRILTAFDLVAPAEQLLGTSLRPAPGTWQARVLVTLQRLAARWARRRHR